MTAEIKMPDPLLKHSNSPRNEPWYLRELANEIYAKHGHTEEGQKKSVRLKRIADMLDDAIRALSEAHRANESLVRWKGEIDSHLIAHRVEFPDDYENSPKWAVAKLIECERARDPYAVALEKALEDFIDLHISDDPEFNCTRRAKALLEGNQMSATESLSAAEVGARLRAGERFELLPESHAMSATRTPAEYAIEHAGYLAQSATQFLDACNALHATREACEDADTDEEGAAAAAAYDAALEVYSDHFSGLKDAVYEFEKRRDKALAVKCSEDGDGR